MRQTWQVYYLRVLWWSSLKLMFSGLLQKDLFKGRGSSAEKFFEQNYFHACNTRFAFFFPLPYCCVSSLLVNFNYATGRERKEEGKPCVTRVKIILFETTFRQTSLSFKRIFFVKTVNVEVRWISRQNKYVIVLSLLSRTSVLVSSSSCHPVA